MSKIKVNVSEHNLTRCHTCLRHVSIDRSLPDHELLKLACDFCNATLFTGIKTLKAYQTPFQAVTHRSPVKQQRFGRRGSRLATGLLTIGLALVGCEEENEPVEAGTAVAGVSMSGVEAGMIQPVYGVEAGEAAGTEAGTNAGTEAGTNAGTEAGTNAGTDAGTNAGTDAGTEIDMMVVAGDQNQALYGVEPVGDMFIEVDMAPEVTPMPDYGVEPIVDMSVDEE